MTFTMLCDPGHAWLEVPWTELKRLGLNPTDFSRYSFRKRNVFLLEEDCDVPKFIAAYERNGAKISIVERQISGHEGQQIRSLPRIHGEAA